MKYLYKPNVKNYTSWNIETKPMTLVTYTSRCRKLHLKLLTMPMCSNGWNQGGSTLYKGLGAMLLLSIKWPRLTGVIGTGLWRRHIAYGSWCHMKPIPDEMFIHKLNLQWNLPDEMFIHKVHWQWDLPDEWSIQKWICSETYQIKCLYIKQICSETYQIKCLYIKQICGETYQMKCLCIKQTYVTLDNTPNIISKNIFMSFGHHYKYLEKKHPKFKSKNTTPGEHKGEATVYSVQQLLNLKSLQHLKYTKKKENSSA